MTTNPAPRPDPRCLLGAWLAGLYFTFLAVNMVGGWIPIMAGGREAQADYVSLAVAGELSATDPGRLYDFDAQATQQRAFDPDGTSLRPFANPPFVATAARGLRAVGFSRGYGLLAAINVAGIAVLASVLVRLSRGRPLSSRLLLVVGAMGSMSVGTAMAEGAVSVVAGLGLCLLLLGDREHRDDLMALGLALAVVKPHLAALALVMMVVRRRWAVLVRSGLLLGLMILPTLWSPGLSGWLHYPRALLGAGAGDAAVVGFADHWWNIASVLHHVAGSSMPGALHVVVWLLFVGGYGAVARLHLASPSRLLLGLALVVGLVLLPHSNPHDALWVPVAFALVWADRSWQHRRPAHRGVLVALAVLWPLVSVLAVAFASSGGSILAVGWLLSFAIIARQTTPTDRQDHASPGRRPATSTSASAF